MAFSCRIKIKFAQFGRVVCHNKALTDQTNLTAQNLLQTQSYFHSNTPIVQDAHTAHNQRDPS